MPKNDLPHFIIYQPNPKEFHICFEVGGKYVCWLSSYPPTLDIRFTREVKRIADIPANKIPKKNIFDTGIYAVAKTDTKQAAGKKMMEGVKGKSFPFTLNGKKLNGRFAFKKEATGTVIQKYKDKYAVEEDILSGDLSRTISTMIPDYDESKITLGRPKKVKSSKLQAEEEQSDEPLTADTVIGKTEYHFAFYTSEDEPELCIVTNANGEAIILKKVNNNWALMPTVLKSRIKSEDEIVRYAKELFLQIP